MIGLVPAEKLVDYVGQEIGSSDWFEVDQDRIDKFADATLDHQFIHVDTEKATPLFGSTIAHGFLSYDKNPCAIVCLLYTSPSPRDLSTSRMPSSA